MFLRNSRAEVSNSIHVSLSGALFLLNISFMLSEWAATLSAKEFCVFIAVMIHYSLLSCFTWMAVEALHLYLLLIRVFNIYVKYYMTKLSLIGWGEYNNIKSLQPKCLRTILTSVETVFATQLLS